MSANERDRRELLAASAATIPDLVLGSADEECVSPGAGPNVHYFPNVALETHEGERLRFYDDLLLGRTVLIHCMSIAGDDDYPVVANLAKVQDELGERLGREVFMYSLTVDPERDTPEALRAFAVRHGARPGWLFLTGLADDVSLLRRKLFAHNGMHLHGGMHPHGAHSGSSAKGKDCSVGLARYGNEKIGLWGSVPSKSNPEWIARRLSWVTVREPRDGGFRRGGPHPLGAPS